MGTIKPDTMDPLTTLEPRDLDQLLGSDPACIPGMIMRLNHAPRYHNHLDAIAITSRLLEMRACLRNSGNDRR